MAEEAIKNELNCSICLDTYTDPKILQCFHVYCQKCLVKLVVRDQQGQLSLSCPICRHVTPIPDKGTAGLQSDFRVNRLLEILNEHKKDEGELASPEKVDKKAESPSQCVNPALYCSQHDKREVELFCETCGELICSMCAIKGGKHHSHDYLLINESFERYREKVTPSLELMEKKMTTTTKVLTQLDRDCEEIINQQAAIKAYIQDSSRQLHKVIKKRENELIGKLDHITRRKLKSLATQRDQIETLQAQLSSCVKFTRESLQTEINQPEVLAMKMNVLKQVGELTSSSQPDFFTHSTKADVHFLASADATTACESFGRVFTPNSPDPSKCFATGRGLQEAVVGEKATAVLNCGQPSIDALASYEAQLVSDITGSTLIASVEYCSTKHQGQGQCLVSYQPTAKGRHQLHIKADGQHIRGSPFTVVVKLPVEKLGTPILTLKDLGKPWGVAVNSKGEVIVTKWTGNCVTVLSPCTQIQRSFGMHGSYSERYQFRCGVTVDGEDNLLVTDRYNHCIQKFTTDGNFLEAIVSTGALQFNEPCGITYSTNNNRVYVVDGENHCIQVLNSDLKSISVFGKEGSGKGQFSRPRGIATDSTGNVYVADSGNHRIQVFTAEGKFLRMFGREGAGEGELDYPFDLAVDASSQVYVSEYDNHRVSVFTSKGKFLKSFGSRGSGPRQFDVPRGIAVDVSGAVYVCDCRNNRIQIF